MSFSAMILPALLCPACRCAEVNVCYDKPRFFEDRPTPGSPGIAKSYVNGDRHGPRGTPARGLRMSRRSNLYALLAAVDLTLQALGDSRERPRDRTGVAAGRVRLGIWPRDLSVGLFDAPRAIRLRAPRGTLDDGQRDEKHAKSREDDHKRLKMFNNFPPRIPREKDELKVAGRVTNDLETRILKTRPHTPSF